jgi:glycosyltransferase involved in cell wall biosynthesis/tetratricopeptide (TPR) repeat protein
VEEADIRVLYHTESSLHTGQYGRLQDEFSRYGFVGFVPENDFRSDVMALLAPYENVLFLVDDNIFIEDFCLRDAIEALDEDQSALGFSLRVGRNTNYCYPLDAPQRLPAFTPVGKGTLRFDWRTADHDFGYPLEVSSSLYRTDDLFPLLAELPFRNPNTLEEGMAAKKALFAQEKPHLLCLECSATFCAPVNKVQSVVAENRSGSDINQSPESLAVIFERGSRIRIEAFCGFRPNACHQEVKLVFSRPAPHADPAPLVSVVIPCYNQARFLSEAVASVVAQTYSNWECLIVNDGSPDNTSDVARELIARYSGRNIRLLEKPNGGLPDARNFGIRSSCGIYWLPLDADDRIAPQFLDKTVPVLQQCPEIGFVYSHIQHFGNQSDLYRLPEFDADTVVYKDNICCVCSLVRKSIWSEVGGYNAEMREGYEDWDFWISCIEKGWKGHRIPEPLFYYRKRVDSMLNGSNQKREELMARIVLNHPQLYDELLREKTEQIVSRYDESVSATPPAVRGNILIACSHFWPSVGGVETIAENLGFHLAQRGYQVEVATWARSDRTDTTHRGIKIIELVTTQTKQGVPDWVPQLRTLAISAGYDACILLADPQNLIIWSLESAEMPAGTKLLIQPLINEDGFGNWRHKQEFRSRLAAILKKSDGVIALSRNGAEMRFFQEEGITPIYVPNAVEKLPGDPGFRRRYGINATVPFLLHVANLWPVKNHDGLLRTIRAMPGDWRLVMIGHPSGDAGYVERVAQAASRDSRVILIPGLPPEEVAAAMAAADIVLLASHGEVSPVTIMEAMSHGKPWLATPSCGAVHDFAGGVIAPLERFPEILATLLSRRDLMAALGNAGHSHWQACFTWQVVAGAWAELIRAGTFKCAFEMPVDVEKIMKSISGEISMPIHCSSSNTPLVSVIIPTYNRPAMLKRAIESVLTQTHKDFEIVVVNDCGTDVESLLTSLQARTPITYVRHGKNMERAAARNTGLKLAKGKYIAYLDDDDIFYPDHLETLLTHITKNQAAVAYTDANRGWQVMEGDTYVTVKRDTPYSFDFDYDKILVTNFIPILCIMHEKECIEQAGLFDETLSTHEDWDLWIRMSRRYTFHHVKKVTSEFSWRNDGTSTTSSRSDDFVRTMHIIYNKYTDYAAHNPAILNAQQATREIRKLPSDDSVQKTGIVCQPTSKGLSSGTNDNGHDHEQLLKCADTLVEEREFEDALSFYQNVLDSNPESIRALIGIGVVNLLTKRFSEAAISFTKVLSREPNNAKALCGLGMARTGQGRKNVGYEYFVKALKSDPENITALNELFRAAYDSGKFTDAIACARNYLIYHPGDLDILYSLAGILYKSDAFQDACEAMERLLALSPEYQGGKELLESISTASVKNAPLKSANEVNTSSDDSVARLIEQGRINKAAGKYSEAFECFSKARKLDDISVLSEMGDCKANVGDMKGARVFYEEGLLNNGDDVRSLVGLGVVSLLEENLTDSGGYFDKALKAENGNPKALCGLAMLRNREGRESEAHDLFTQALDSDPENLTALFELVKCAYRLERFDRAELHLRNYLRYHPADMKILFSLAGVLLKMEKRNEAQEKLETILLFDPEFEGAWEMQQMIGKKLPIAV